MIWHAEFRTGSAVMENLCFLPISDGWDTNKFVISSMIMFCRAPYGSMTPI